MPTENEPVFDREKLKDLRIKQNLSIPKLKKLSGIHESVIYRLEKGILSRPTFDTVAALSLGLGVSTDVFINQRSL